MSKGKTSDLFVLYTLDDEVHGINVTDVISIERIMPMTRLPNAQYFVQGVINLRGEIIPVINLKKRFGMQQTEHNDENRIIIAIVNDFQVGIMVDSVLEITNVEKDRIQRATEVVSGEYGDLIDGITEHNGSIVYFPDYPTVLGLNNI